MHSLDLLFHSDWSEPCFHQRRWTQVHLRESTCAYLSTPEGDSCSASVHTVSGDARSWGNQGRWFNWQSCFSSNNNAILFWAIALAKENRIKLSVTTNIHYNGRMMKRLLWREFQFLYFPSDMQKWSSKNHFLFFRNKVCSSARVKYSLPACVLSHTLVLTWIIDGHCCNSGPASRQMWKHRHRLQDNAIKQQFRSQLKKMPC